MSSNVRTDCANSSLGWLDTRSGGHCAMGSMFLQWNCGNIKTGNAHPHAITNSTNHVQPTPLMYPAQVTIRPITMIVKEAKPMGA